MSEIRTVTLGDRTYPVVPQKHARVRKYLRGDLLKRIMSKDYSHEAYYTLCKMVPAVEKGVYVDGNMIVEPTREWEFDGFHTEEAWQRYKAGDEDAYDEDNDPSPETDQIVYAFEQVLMANGAGRLGKLVSLMTTVADLSPVQQTGTQRGSLGENGDSTSTPTGTTVQT